MNIDKIFDKMNILNYLLIAIYFVWMLLVFSTVFKNNANIKNFIV